jgi:glycerol-3-phosphate dehydrogenase (NAD(P)+)
MSTAKPAVTVLGAGSWGTALAALLARHDYPTLLWGRDAAQVAKIDRGHENPRYLPGVVLPDSLHATDDLAAAVAVADLLLVVTPSHAFNKTLRALAPHRRAGVGVAWATKGFEPGSGRFLHEVAAECLGDDVPLAVVTGPSFAKEVAMGLPTAVTVHSDREDFARTVAEALHGPAFRAYTGSDMLGAELGERAGCRHRHRRRHVPGPQCPRWPDHARTERNAAPQRRLGRARGNADWTGRPG